MGKPFRIQTDHRALQWLNKFKEKNRQLTRWSLALQPFTFTIEHKKGKDNANADTLSRMPEYVFQPLEGRENVTEPETRLIWSVYGM